EDGACAGGPGPTPGQDLDRFCEPRDPGSRFFDADDRVQRTAFPCGGRVSCSDVHRVGHESARVSERSRGRRSGGHGRHAEWTQAGDDDACRTGEGDSAMSNGEGCGIVEVVVAMVLLAIIMTTLGGLTFATARQAVVADQAMARQAVALQTVNRLS